MKNKTQFLKAKVQLKENGKGITVIATDETLDRHGDVLPIDQWDLTKFMLAPRMLVDHDHTVASIVGKWGNIRIEGKALLMDADFHGITDLAKAVEEMVMKGYLDTVSVGFIWHGAERDGDRPSFELIETSWVTVPANPSARVVKDLLSKSLTSEEKEAVKEFDGGDIESDDLLPEDDEEPIVEEGEEPTNAPAASESVPPVEEEERSLISSIETFKAFDTDEKNKDVAKVECSVQFVRELILASEQLSTLTESGVSAERSARIMKASLKEAAGIVSHALRELNQNKIIS